ncbi:type I phosphodiesterase/nucleotide pyrophosphatase [Chitinophaga skermanii]|uniref:Type I phosphodiesterase/nucleotide pyrophosphatase n=1 Tax=Chitinophaga skermanii TaxID=331697 RepID=A0A327QHL5_9BACT|nr:alkaline phosphatase family protein [Chitinophaga skermanii]RAJ04039.1 type I phosphodiesterase/nucleotide pyrophosphatase [Chitinophaga skermanii]
MKKIILCLASCVCLLSAQAQQTRKAVFIIVDGIPADVIEKQPTPNLDKIAGKNGYMRAYVGGERGGYSQTPTISAVGYNSLLTGTWVNKHNVWDNDIKAQNYNYWSIFRYFKAQYPTKQTAIFSTWLDNRTKLVGDNLAQTNFLKIDHHVDGLELDTARFPHDKQSWYIHRIDSTVVKAASEYLAEKAPDLTWVYLEYSDDMGHRHGDSQQMYGAVKMVDEQVGAIWNAIQSRAAKNKEDWMIVITTDHGRDSVSGHHHGGQSNRERGTWIVTNQQQLNAYAKHNTPGIVDIMPSIAEFMKIKIPAENLREVDGISLLGKVSVAKPTAALNNEQLDITWDAIDKTGDVKIYVSTTNNFKEGGKDTYKLMKTVQAATQKATVDVKDMKSGYYKIVLEGKYNTVNRWVIVK